MTPARFGLQAVLVVTLGGVVSFPEQRQVGAGAFSSTSSAGATAAGGLRDVLASTASASDRRQLRIGFGSVSEFAVGPKAASALRERLYDTHLQGQRRPAPSDLLGFGGKINAVVGYAQLRSGLVPFARVLLRSVATGLVEARAIADEHGRFIFVDVLPSDYIIELVDANGAVLTTSDVVRVGVNEIRMASVRPRGAATLASFGGQVTPGAQQTIDAAATQGVKQVSAPGRCASPPCDSTNP